MEKSKLIFTSKKAQLSWLFILFSVWMSMLSQKLILTVFPQRLINADLFFTFLPYISSAQYISDIVLIVGVLLFIFQVVIKYPHRFPYYATSIGTMYIVRSFYNILTPMMNPLGEGVGHGLLQNAYYQPGMFTSGHASLAFLIFLLVEKKEQPRLKLVLGAIAIIETISMLLSRGHYSIDVVAALMLSYIIFVLFQERKDSLLIED